MPTGRATTSWSKACRDSCRSPGEAGGAPQKVGVAVTDILTGLYGAIGILAAIEQRHRTDRGQHVDMALLDCATAALANQAMNYLVTGVAPVRQGIAHPNIAPYQVFATADGHVIVAVGNDGQFRRLFTVLGLEEIAADPPFATNGDRVASREALTDTLATALARWPSAALLSALEREGVPAGPINTIAEVFTDQQVVARGLLIAPEGVPGVRSPWVFSEADLPDTPAPMPRLPSATGSRSSSG